MSCVKEIPCGLTRFANHQRGCQFCGMVQNGTRSTGCGQAWFTQAPREEWWGHGTDIWLMDHGHASEEGLSEALTKAREWFTQALGSDGRGYFVVRDYDGHAALELFRPAKTIPLPLSDAIAEITHEAALWFFDLKRLLPDPEPYYHELGEEEIERRLRAYQYWIDKETGRSWNQMRYKILPPLVELPEEQRKRLVGWWDRLWFDFLGQHPDWRWTPALGFWKAAETIYPLTEEAHG